MIVARDTTREINETAKDLRDRGVIRDTAESYRRDNDCST